MLFFAVTKPKKKVFLVAKILFLAFLLGVAVPSIYYGLSDAGAMESFMQGWLNKGQDQTRTVVANNGVKEVDLYIANGSEELGGAAAANAPAETLPGEPLRVMNDQNAADPAKQQPEAVPSNTEVGEAPEDIATSSAGPNPLPEQPEPVTPNGGTAASSGETGKTATEGQQQTANQPEKPAAAGQAGQATGAAQPEQQMEKPGLLQRLKIAIFGETPQVEIYQNTQPGKK